MFDKWTTIQTSLSSGGLHQELRKIRLGQEQIVLLITAGLVILFGITLSGFASWGNVMALLRSTSIFGVFALGMAVVIIGRGIDLSQVAIALVSSGIAVKFMINGLPLPVALLFGFAIAIGLGILNGIIISYLEVPAFFTTLASAFLFVGVAREWVIKSMLINIPAENTSFLTLGQTWLSVPIPLIVFIICAICLHLFLSYTTLGRFIYAHGDNPETARLTGIPVHRLTLLAYVLCAVLAYIGGLLMIASTALVDLKTIQSTFIFDVIMIVILGGVSLSGGRGSVLSVLAGALLIGVLLNGMTMMNMGYQLQNIIKGIVLLIVIVLDTWLYPYDEETSQQGI